MSNRRRMILIGAVLPLFLCLGLVLTMAAINSRRPTESTDRENLGAAQKALLAEADHLRESAGNDVWPGYGAGRIPLVTYNEEYVFLVGMEDEPPAGWRSVPQDRAHGTSWSLITADDLSYYRAVLPPDGHTPQAFTVMVGDQPAASLQTHEAMEIALMEQFENDLPDIFRPIFPYEIVAGLFIGQPETYISALLHEGFHAHVQRTAPQRLAQSEAAQSIADTYPWEDDGLIAAWEEELALLQSAVRAEERSDVERLAREFLAQRDARRADIGLTAAQIAFENQREWLEGLAKYVELQVYRAGRGASYEPLPVTTAIDGFDDYEKFQQRWDQEVDQITRMADDPGDGRFYYSGFAQGVILDELLPGWKERALEPGVFLEDLLREALASPS